MSHSAPDELAALVKSAALDVGFARVGITPATRPSHFDQFVASLNLGLHATMGWLARSDSVATREDPSLLLPGATSLLMVAARYADGGESETGLARYARFVDYHGVLGDRLQRLAAWVEGLGGRARTFCDSSSVCEVDHAVAAGLGWRGKNSLLLNADGGSWYLLGGLVTDLALTPDEPMAERCGTCMRCLDACPTGALIAPYVLDARRCISYLTIEQRDSIDPVLSERLGQWAFGCDICQEVCPWCRPRPGSTVDNGLSIARHGWLPESKWLVASPAELAAAVARTPLTRPKRAGLLRNICLRLGNQTSLAPTERDHLRQAAKDADDVLAEAAKWALAQHPDEPV